MFRFVMFGQVQLGYVQLGYVKGFKSSILFCIGLRCVVSRFVVFS